MKRIIATLALCLPFLVFGQISNSDFENWDNSSGIYEPVDWSSNNAPVSVSVTRTTDSYSGNYALQVINNAPSIEGPLPGHATTSFVSSGMLNKISAYVKCDSIEGTGKGIIKVYGYSDSSSEEIGYWETSTIIPSYTLVEISISPVAVFDSIEIVLEAYSESHPLGYPTGFARMKVDKITVETITKVDELDYSQNFRIFPNPCSNTLNIYSTGHNFEKVLLMDLNGKVISNQKVHNSIVQLNIEKLHKGIYLVQLVTNKRQFITSKILIEY